MKMKSPRVVLITVILFAGWPSDGVKVSAEECLRESMEGRLPIQSILSAVAVPDTDQENHEKIVITDQPGPEGMVLELKFKKDGRLAESIPQKKVGFVSRTDFRPSTASKASGGFVQILEDFDSGGVPMGILFLDNSLRERGYTELVYEDLKRPDRVKNSDLEGRVLALYDWTAAGDIIFAYGALGDPAYKERISMGFFIYQMKSPGSREVRPVAHFVDRFLDRSYYSLSCPYIVSSGSWVYYLRMGITPELLAFNYYLPGAGEPISLDGFRGQDWILPRVSAGDPSSYENEKIPEGLYVANDYLYALYREPAGNHLVWTFDKLRPRPGSEEVEHLGSVRLPITADARRLTLVHMEERAAWAIFESSGQQPDKTRTVLSMVTIPEAWIEERLGEVNSLVSFKAPDRRECRLLD